MCLKNIDISGKINSIYALLKENNIIDTDKGINNAGTFHNICKECDGKMFQEYENEESYSKDFSSNDKLFSQIALKNILRDIYKHECEIELLNTLPKEANQDFFTKSLADMFTKPLIKARKMDIDECYSALAKCVSNIQTNTSWLEIVICETLDYVVPVAYQGMIAITTGFNNEIINDKLSDDKSYAMEYIHLAVLPLSNKSVIMLFMDKDNKRYDQFKIKIKRLSKTKKVQLINYLIFWYCEDYYIYKGLSEKAIKTIEEAASSCEDCFSTDQTSILTKEAETIDLNKAWSFKNILGIHV